MELPTKTGYTFLNFAPFPQRFTVRRAIGKRD